MAFASLLLLGVLTYTAYEFREERMEVEGIEPRSAEYQSLSAKYSTTASRCGVDVFK